MKRKPTNAPLEMTNLRNIKNIRGASPFLAAVQVAALLLAVINMGGCSRTFWRQHADRETYRVLAEKMSDPRWAVPRTNLQADPRSRFYDPYDPDEPPLPPDDPAAHQYMHWMHGMHGYKGWHDFCDTFSVENPQWLEPFGLTPEMTEGDPQGDLQPLPELKNLTLRQAIELAYIHNRDFQFQLENLYLTALSLTFERFRYDVQFLGIGGREPTASLDFESIPSGQNSLDGRTRIGISKLLPTGGQWAVEFANNTLWLLSFGNNTNSASTLSYSIIQPLLLGGGRKIVLEGLTQSERDALYALRDFARFRKEFFVDVVAGGGTGNVTLGAAGGFGGGLTTGGFGFGFGGGGSGYLGLVQQRQNIVNQEGNIRALEVQLARLRALASERPSEISESLPQLPEGLTFPESVAHRIRHDNVIGFLFWRGPMTEEQRDLLVGLSNTPDYQRAIQELFLRTVGEITTLDVAQLENDLIDARGNLIQAKQRFQDSLDQYKIQLGLPPDMEATIDESMLKPFQLIDPKLTALQQLLDEFLPLWAKIDEDDPQAADLQRATSRLTQIKEVVRRDGLDLVARDQARVQENLESRLSSLDSEEDREHLLRDVARDRRLFENITRDFEEVQAGLNRLSGALEHPRVPLQLRKIMVPELADLREELLRIVQGLSVVQVYSRVELITLEPFDLSRDGAVAIGLENRLDLMNARGEVMDARRRVEVSANRLEAVLDVVVAGDINTRSLGAGNNNPLDFRADESSFRAGLAFTAPLVQIRERNDYRAALITYQRARRDYMETEDDVKREIRQDWRRLEANRQNFEIARQSVKSAALQFDQTVERTREPVAPGARRQDQGLNLIRAIDSILRAQNNLIGIWVDYESSRLNFFRDLGIMEIDAQGVWVDDYYQNRIFGKSKPGAVVGVESEGEGVLRFPSSSEGDSDGPDFTPTSVLEFQPLRTGQHDGADRDGPGHSRRGRWWLGSG